MLTELQRQAAIMVKRGQAWHEIALESADRKRHKQLQQPKARKVDAIVVIADRRREL